MHKIAMAAIGVSVLTFLTAIVMVVVGIDSLLGVAAEGFSRASSNIALIAIALGVWAK